MAYKWRKPNGDVYVSYYDRTTKAVATLDRALTAHLDPLPDPAVDAWVREWEASSGVARVRSRRRSLASDDALAGMIQAFLDEHAALRDAKASTRQDLRHHLEHYAVEFFVRHHAQRDVQRWAKHTAGFPLWLRTTHPNMRVTSVKKVIQSLRRFGEYLATHQVIPQPWLLPLPQTKQRPKTPLVRAITPEAVLAAAGKLPPRWALAVLLGYFASLRPEETYALAKSDFLTGDRAKRDAKTHGRFVKLGLGSGLAVSITKTKTRVGDEPLVKTHYAYGVVNIWSLEAARAAGTLLHNLPNGPLFAGKRQAIDREYRELVKPLLDCAAYDLRRASGLYLGRTIGVEPFLLQDHFRHSTITTTMLYTRRPLDEQETVDTQDFDDVS